MGGLTEGDSWRRWRTGSRWRPSRVDRWASQDHYYSTRALAKAKAATTSRLRRRQPRLHDSGKGSHDFANRAPAKVNSGAGEPQGRQTPMQVNSWADELRHRHSSVGCQIRQGEGWEMFWSILLLWLLEFFFFFFTLKLDQIFFFLRVMIYSHDKNSGWNLLGYFSHFQYKFNRVKQRGSWCY